MSEAREPLLGQSRNLQRRYGTDNDTAPAALENETTHLKIVLPPTRAYEGYHRFDPTVTWTPAEEVAVVRKCDLRVCAWACVMFFGLQLDRGNISNALTDNFLGDLGLTTDDYNNGSTIQHLCFLAAEFPVQLLTKRFGFRRVLPVLIMLWSTVAWAQAWVSGRTSYYITRGLIGLFEGGFIPGLILFMTYFYTSRELSTRLAALWSTLNLARVISSLLAAGILQMRGVAGKPGWFWLFLLEGLLTFIIGAISAIYLPDSPVRTQSVLFRKPWFSEREETIMVNRLLRNDPAKGRTELKEPARWADIQAAWLDPAMAGFYAISLVSYLPAIPVQYYLSISLRRMGFTTFNANMLSVPSAALQIVLMTTLSWSSDRAGERAWHCVAGEAWLLPLLMALEALPAGERAWERFSLMTLVAGYPDLHPIVGAWISENSFDVKKRSISTATSNALVQVGFIIASQIYRKNDAPYYYQGNCVLIVLCGVSLVAIVAQKQWLRYLNERKAEVWDSMSVEEKIKYQKDFDAREKDGNKRLDFAFQL